MNSPLFTVLIDTYNYGRFIQDAIDSVLSQDFSIDQMQILVVDDGSTDDTAQRIAKYGSRIQYFRKSNGGQASAFNFGIAKARGEIVALLDADDFWLPGKLSAIAKEFEEHPDAGMVYHRLLEYNSQTGERKEASFRALSGFLPDKPSEFFWYIPYPTSCLAFRQEFLRQLLPIPEGLRVQADAYLGLCIVFLAPVFAIPESLAVYRIHGQNLFYEDETKIPPERRKLRIMTRQILMDGVQSWLSNNDYDLTRTDIRRFLTRWRLYQDGDRFILRPPSRLQFFLHLLRYIRCYGPSMSRRLLLINSVNAVGAVVTGYEHFHLLDKWHTQWPGKLRMRRP